MQVIGVMLPPTLFCMEVSHCLNYLYKNKIGLNTTNIFFAVCLPLWLFTFRSDGVSKAQIGVLIVQPQWRVSWIYGHTVDRPRVQDKSRDMLKYLTICLLLLIRNNGWERRAILVFSILCPLAQRMNNFSFICPQSLPLFWESVSKWGNICHLDL